MAELFERALKGCGSACGNHRHRVVRQTPRANSAILTDLDGIAHEYLIPKDKHVTVHDGQVVNKGEMIVDGPADPHDILRLQGMEALARYITDEVQDVYRLQGVRSTTSTVEVIVRQMLRRVTITDSGDSRFIPGEQLERADVLEENDRVKEGKKCRRLSPQPARHHQGIAIDRFLHLRCIVPGNHPRCLPKPRSWGKRDDLRGLKENVIVGRLIPAGTGLAYHRTRKKAFRVPQSSGISFGRRNGIRKGRGAGG